MENYIIQIKQILEKTGWTQSQLAQEVGVTFASVNRWLHGHAKPHPGQIRSINNLFKNIIGIIPLTQKEISTVIKTVINKKRKFKNIARLLESKEISDDFLIELTYNSDAIEGSTLTKRETESIIFDKAVIKDKSLIEHIEASNHAAILADIFEGNYTSKIDEDLIKSLHKALMHGIRQDAGSYSRYLRGIRGVNLILPHPDDIPEEMRYYCNRVNNFKGHVIGHIARMHADFEAIHPFGDGNGRVGRLIMIMQLINKGFAPCVIAVNDKFEYYEYLEYAQKKSETHLVRFIAEAVLQGYRIIEKYKK